MEPHDHHLSDYFDIEHVDTQIVLKPHRRHTSLCILDEGLLHTAICSSNISRIDPATPQITYRGHDVTTLAEQADFLDVAVLLLTGETQSTSTLAFKRLIARYTTQLAELPALPFIRAPEIDPVDTLIRSVLAASAAGKVKKTALNGPLPVAAFLLAAIGLAIAHYAQGRCAGNAATHRSSAFMYRGNDAITRLLQATFSCPPDPIAVSLLNRFLILHAEHGLNCSTLAVRTAASSGADPIAAIIAGMCAFKGPLHGGASTGVGMLYDRLLQESLDIPRYIDGCLAQGHRLLGIGHRLYTQLDPRAAYMQRLLHNARADFSSVFPYIELSDAIVHHVNHRPYFTQRGLSPNPDLFNGILLRRIGFPSEMNTLLLCLSRTVGWLAHYYDSVSHKAPLIRPQELYADEKE